MKIEIDRSVVQHALDALEAIESAEGLEGIYSWKPEITALREALAAANSPKSGGVAPDWKLPPLPEPGKKQGQQMSYDGDDKVFFDCYDNAQMAQYAKDAINLNINEALAAPNSVEIDGIKATERDTIAVNLLRHAGLDKHKARECAEIVLQVIAAANKQARQAPVSCMHFTDEQISRAMDGSGFCLYGVPNGTPLYTTPQPAQPTPDALHLAAMDLARKQAQHIAELEAEIQDMDRLMRASVPDRWKACTSPAGAVQSYIAELEEQLEALVPLTDEQIDEALLVWCGNDIPEIHLPLYRDSFRKALKAAHGIK